jgi:hypothetical protein
MRVYSLTELFCMARNELFALHAETVAALAAPGLTGSETDAANAQLRNIRRALAHPRNAPG